MNMKKGKTDSRGHEEDNKPLTNPASPAHPDLLYSGQEDSLLFLNQGVLTVT